jgi:hypothetical protein
LLVDVGAGAVLLAGVLFVVGGAGTGARGGELFGAFGLGATADVFCNPFGAPVGAGVSVSAGAGVGSGISGGVGAGATFAASAPGATSGADPSDAAADTKRVATNTTTATTTATPTPIGTTNRPWPRRAGAAAALPAPAAPCTSGAVVVVTPVSGIAVATFAIASGSAIVPPWCTSSDTAAAIIGVAWRRAATARRHSGIGDAMGSSGDRIRVASGPPSAPGSGVARFCNGSVVAKSLSSAAAGTDPSEGRLELGGGLASGPEPSAGRAPSNDALDGAVTTTR